MTDPHTCASGDLMAALVRLLTSLLMARRSVARSAWRRATAWNCKCQWGGKENLAVDVSECHGSVRAFMVTA